MRFKIQTTFDITSTGVTGHFKGNRVPFYDHAGHEIEDIASWNRSRNQQRNWETLTQIISLRTQIDEISDPIEIDDLWEFTFTATSPDAYGPNNEILLSDCRGVPMIVDLGSGSITGVLTTHGDDQNIWITSLE